MIQCTCLQLIGAGSYFRPVLFKTVIRKDKIISSIIRILISTRNNYNEYGDQKIPELLPMMCDYFVPFVDHFDYCYHLLTIFDPF